MLEDDIYNSVERSEDGWYGIYKILDLPIYDSNNEIRTKLEVTARDIDIKKGEMYATLVFHVKLWDEEEQTYRDIYKTRVKKVLLYNVGLNSEDNKSKLGGLEKLVKSFNRISREVGVRYSRFLQEDDDDYNEIDEDDKDTYLYDVDEDDLPLVFPMYFTELIQNISIYLANTYIKDIELS